MMARAIAFLVLSVAFAGCLSFGGDDDDAGTSGPAASGIPSRTSDASSAVPEPAQSDLTATEIRRVNSGGGGVSFRDACAESAIVPGIAGEGIRDGSLVRVVRTGDGDCIGWLLVSVEPDGRESWVQARHLSAPLTTTYLNMPDDPDLIVTGDNWLQTLQGLSLVSIRSGSHQQCGIDDRDRMVCWGRDGAPSTPAPGGSFIDVDAGGLYTCAVDTDHTVQCWGRLDDRQGSPPLGAFRSVRAGILHACGIQSDGLIACWGDNEHGRTDAPPGVFTDLDVSWKYGCAIRENGTVACWGAGDEPEGTFTQISVSDGYGCGIRAQDNSATCWADPEPTTGRLTRRQAFSYRSRQRIRSAAACGATAAWRAGATNLSSSLRPR